MFVHFLAPFGDLSPSLSSGLTSQKATKSKPKLGLSMFTCIVVSFASLMLVGFSSVLSYL